MHNGTRHKLLLADWRVIRDRWTQPGENNEESTLRHLHQHQWRFPRAILRTDFHLVPKKNGRKGQCYICYPPSYFSVPALLQFLLLPANKASTLQAQSPIACPPVQTTVPSADSPRAPSSAVSQTLHPQSDLSGLSSMGSWLHLSSTRLVTPKSASPVQTFLPNSKPTFPNAFCLSVMWTRLNSHVQNWTHYLPHQTQSSSKVSLSRSMAALSAPLPRQKTGSLPHPALIPMVIKCPTQAPNPFLQPRTPPCLGQVLSRYLETSSQHTISPPLMLPSNPPFITTRVSFLKHISAPVLLLLKAFHPTAHERTSTWSTKHANLFWFGPIFQHSPQSNLLSNYIKWLGFPESTKLFLYVPTLYLLCPLPGELLFILRDPLQIPPALWRVPQLFISFRIVVPFSVPQKYFGYSLWGNT